MTKTLGEGTDAVGSLEFVGFTPYMCADVHVTTHSLLLKGSTTQVKYMQIDTYCRLSNNASKRLLI